MVFEYREPIPDNFVILSQKRVDGGSQLNISLIKSGSDRFMDLSLPGITSLYQSGVIFKQNTVY